MMPANPYQCPAANAPTSKRARSAGFAGLLCAIASWSLILLIALGAGDLYLQGRLGILANPTYAGLFVLAFLAGAPAAFFRLGPAARMAAVILSGADFCIWMVYVAPLLQNPRLNTLSNLALGAGVLCFSLAIAVLAALTPNACAAIISGAMGG